MHAPAVLVARRSFWRRSAQRPPTSWCGGRRDITPQEDEAVRETVAAFEQGSGKQVELVFYEQDELPQTARGGA